MPPSVRCAAGNESSLTDYGYTRQRHDDSTGGLMYYKARYYLPSIQHFISADTIVPGRGSQAFNRYSYVLNNPIRYSDPSGHLVCEELDVCTPGGGGGGGSGGGGTGDGGSGSGDGGSGNNGSGSHDGGRGVPVDVEIPPSVEDKMYEIGLGAGTYAAAAVSQAHMNYLTFTLKYTYGIEIIDPMTLRELVLVEKTLREFTQYLGGIDVYRASVYLNQIRRWPNDPETADNPTAWVNGVLWMPLDPNWPDTADIPEFPDGTFGSGEDVAQFWIAHEITHGFQGGYFGMGWSGLLGPLVPDFSPGPAYNSFIWYTQYVTSVPFGVIFNSTSPIVTRHSNDIHEIFADTIAGAIYTPELLENWQVEWLENYLPNYLE